MAGQLFYLFFVTLCIVSTETAAKDADAKRKMKVTLLSAEYNCDGNYVQYFGLAPGSTQALLANLTKPIKDIFLDIRVANEETQRTIYKIENFGACSFLNNRLIYQIYSSWYDAVVGNTTHFKCPFRPGIYYLENKATSNLVPHYFPVGTFSLAVRSKPTHGGPFAVELVWRFRVVRK